MFTFIHHEGSTSTVK